MGKKRQKISRRRKREIVVGSEEPTALEAGDHDQAQNTKAPTALEAADRSQNSEAPVGCEATDGATATVKKGCRKRLVSRRKKGCPEPSVSEAAVSKSHEVTEINGSNSEPAVSRAKGPNDGLGSEAGGSKGDETRATGSGGAAKGPDDGLGSETRGSKGDESRATGSGGAAKGPDDGLGSEPVVGYEGQDGAAGLNNQEDEDDCEVNEDIDLEEADAEENGEDDEVNNEARGEEFSVLFGSEFRNDDNEDTDGDSGDEIWDDERIPDPYSSDEDEEVAAYKETEDPDEQLALGKTFGSAEDFKLVLLRYSLKTRYDIKFYKSTAMIVAAKCSDSEGKCDWRVYCSYERRKRKLMIKVLVKDHICVRSGHSKMLKRSTIAMLFSERLRLNPKLTKHDMAAEIRREYGLIVTDEQCGKAKTKVLQDRKKSHEDHFGRIWDYQAEVLRSNPESSMEIETIPGPTIGSIQRFYRLYVCFASQKETWKKSCRPIIGLDGAFLKWDIKGQLLAVVGRDGDNRIVPIAWAVVEVENDTNWDWFIRHLSRDLVLEDGRELAILSDKQKVSSHLYV